MFIINISRCCGAVSVYSSQTLHPNSPFTPSASAVIQPVLGQQTLLDVSIRTNKHNTPAAAARPTFIRETIIDRLEWLSRGSASSQDVLDAHKPSVMKVFKFPFLAHSPQADCVLMLVPESSAHIGQTGGKHAVCGRSGPHHHHGPPRLTDPGQCAAF